MLRRCFPPSLRDALEKLPETLDETYERILLGIDKEKREYAHRLLQCVAVAMRPLAAQELAEVLAMRFDSGEIPHYHVNWRQDDSREAVLSACSSLVTVVNVDGSSIVQFSHFSVKEYLSSHRLAEAPPNLSRYYIDSLSAHTILAQASLCILLHLDDAIDRKTIEDFPFAPYAAQHWVDHGRIEGVSASIQDAMERLFDANNPSFATWLWIYDIDYPLKEPMFTPHPTRPEAVPLYYATLCGFRGVVEHLLTTRPGDTNARGGSHATPLHAALAQDNLEIAAVLLNHDADVDALDRHNSRGALHIASKEGHCDNVRFLLERHPDVNMEDRDGLTPLELASYTGELEVVGILLKHGATASVDPREKQGQPPLSMALALRNGHQDVVKLLIQSGAPVESCQTDGWTWSSLFDAAVYGHLEIVRLLIKSGAAVDYCHSDGWTPLYVASRYGYQDVVQLLIQSGAAVKSRENNGCNPLFGASTYGYLDVVQLLIQSGAAVNSRENNGCTPLFGASEFGYLDIVLFLIQSGAAVDSRDDNGRTPLFGASMYGHLDIVRLLIKSGAAVDSRQNNGWTPLMLASRNGRVDIAQELLYQNADANAQNPDLWTSLHLASACGHLNIAKFLIQYRAEIDKKTNDGETALNEASRHGHLEIVRVLLENGSNPNSQDVTGWTPLHDAAHRGYLEIVKLLLEFGANLDLRNHDDETPSDVASANGKWDLTKFLVECVVVYSSNDPSVLSEGGSVSRSQCLPPDIVPPSLDDEDHEAYEQVVSPPDIGNISLQKACIEGYPDVIQSLIDRGVDVNERGDTHETPLAVASGSGNLEATKILIKNGADVNSRDKYGWTPLHHASQHGHFETVRLLLNEGADVNSKEQEDWSALHLASANNHIESAQRLLERGAIVDIRNNRGRTPSDEASRRGFLRIVGLLSQDASGVR